MTTALYLSLEKRLIAETAILRDTARDLLALCAAIRRSEKVADAPEDREEAQHDHPNGPAMGWSADEFAADDYATPEEQDAAGVLLSDGTQKEED
jgi:hypothetical protein